MLQVIQRGLKLVVIGLVSGDGRLVGSRPAAALESGRGSFELLNRWRRLQLCDGLQQRPAAEFFDPDQRNVVL